MAKKQKIAVLTGAGISAESGINTFRDAGGLWEGHDVMEVASPEGWRKNQALVLDFYNQRRRQLKEVVPNAGHTALVELEKKYDVVVITQNVDNLHERAGSSHIIHLHGELRKVRSTGDETLIYDWEADCNLGDRCAKGYQLRPHIVWFGEAVPAMEQAVEEIYNAEIILIVGTSMQVYPAAGLVGYAARGARIFYVDPRPSINYELQQLANLTVIAEPATTGMKQVLAALL
ncbi:MAG: NAD-dependent protein deacylase [Bacteroidetes bacterium]|nr:MAG: NAD-dependent protein deacylase [Bacteroidota bacterium]PTM12270.1 MAG: NAD-dependent protein deacylase [Bacteroidota bacterium]